MDSDAVPLKGHSSGGGSARSNNSGDTRVGVGGEKKNVFFY